LNPETQRIKFLGDSIPHEKVRKTFFRFVEMFNDQIFMDIKGQPPQEKPSKMIVGVRFTKNFVGATILIDGNIREKTYERMATFEGRESWGRRCFGDIKIVDGYLALEISSMDYDPDAPKKESKN
jgi:hypothetical protein